MKKQLNEIKRMQLIAGLITESEYQKSVMNENDKYKNIPTITDVEVEGNPAAIGLRTKIVLTLSDGEIVSLTASDLNGIYGNRFENPKEVIGSKWEQDPYIDDDYIF